MTPTQRTLAKLREEGWTAAIVEKWNPHAKIRQDMGGFADILAWAPNRGVLAVQATSGSNVAAHVTKLCAVPTVPAWLLSPARLEIWGWRKVGPRGKRKVWEVRRVVFWCRNGVPEAQEAETFET
jgi:hypothetical protein